MPSTARKACLYIYAEQSTVERYREYMRLCAERDNLDVVDEIVERDLELDSALLRSGINELITRAEAKKFDVVIAYRFSRISGKLSEVVTIVKKLMNAGVEIRALDMKCCVSQEMLMALEILAQVSEE